MPVLILEWNAEGRVTVRQESVEVQAERPAIREQPVQVSQLRERATWLGVGTLIGIALAASTLPEPPSLGEPREVASEAPTGFAVARSMLPASTRTASLAPSVPAPSPLREERSDRSVPEGRPTPLLPSSSVATRPVSTSLRVMPAAVAAPRRAPTPPASDTTAVLREVHRFEAALTRMDASATQAAWPAADRDALVRQFTTLREQRLRLARCAVDAPGVTATVTCRGTLSYRPRIGDHTTRTTRGTWRFALERDGERWVIEDVVPPAGGPTP